MATQDACKFGNKQHITPDMCCQTFPENSGHHVLMSSLSSEIAYNVAQLLRVRPKIFAPYTSPNCCAGVHYHNDGWCAEVWVNKAFQETIWSPTLEELKKCLDERWGG